ncbi:MAG: acireductone dioxygenase, partial [Thermoanaerobaculia bacterium]
MATINIRDQNRVLENTAEISEFLARFGIWYRRFEGSDTLADEASQEEILAAYDEPLRELIAEGGYRTADVIDIKPDTPDLQAMLDKFSVEHWHDEDEVRFIVRGRGLF